MSDYEYDYDYNEEAGEEMVEENIETTLEFQNYQAEEYLRDKKIEEALAAFNEIYKKAETNNIKSWKAKSLNQLLEIHLQVGNGAEAKGILRKIRDLNEGQQVDEQPVRSIIKTLGFADRALYQSFWEDIFGLIETIDEMEGKLRCYLLMLSKQIEFKNVKEAKAIHQKITTCNSRQKQVAACLEFELSYFQIMLLKLESLDYSAQLDKLYIKLAKYEDDNNTNQAYLSHIKQEISQTLYKQENYLECANFLCGCFNENSKYGTNPAINKVLLKKNSFVLMLCRREELFEDSDYNSMLSESAARFKGDPDVQAIYGLIEAYRNLDIVQFEQILRIVGLNMSKDSPYADLQYRVLTSLKKQKILQVCRVYKTVTFAHLQRRVNEPSVDNLKKVLLQLITCRKLNGRIDLQGGYLQVQPQENKYYAIQLENLKDLTLRM